MFFGCSFLPAYLHVRILYILQEIIGAVGGKLHTGRSRNDQVATDMRLWFKDAAKILCDHISDLIRVMVTRAQQYVAYKKAGVCFFFFQCLTLKHLSVTVDLLKTANVCILIFFCRFLTDMSLPLSKTLS